MIPAKDFAALDENGDEACVWIIPMEGGRESPASIALEINEQREATAYLTPARAREIAKALNDAADAQEK